VKGWIFTAKLVGFHPSDPAFAGPPPLKGEA